MGEEVNRSGRKNALRTTLGIQCLWDECSSQFTKIMELDTHLSEHLDQLAARQSKGFRRCYWSNCVFELDEDDCILELKRHVYYHGYFEALLVRGRHECQTNPQIPPCNACAWTWTKMPRLRQDFRCQWSSCNRQFLSIVQFHDHVEQHVNFEYEMLKGPDTQKRRIHCCWSYCDKEHDNRYRLMEHVTKHSLKKLMACHHCGELFRCRTNLFDHLQRQPENNTNKNQCAHCFKFFATDKLFRAHVLSHVNCYKCTMCDMTCSSANALSVHIRYRHLKDKPIKCDECDYRCVRKWDLEKHLQWFHRKEMVRCTFPGCDYTVRSYNLLKRHTLEMHKNRPFIYMCHCCERLFKSGKTMSLHLIKKHDYSLPSGHKRFIYRIDEDGFYRLETTRIESQEVTEQILTTTTTTSSSSSSQISSERTTDNDSSSVYYSEPKVVGHEFNGLIGEEDRHHHSTRTTNTTDPGLFEHNNCCFTIVNHATNEDNELNDPVIVSIDDDKLSIPTGKVIISLPSPLS